MLDGPRPINPAHEHDDVEEVLERNHVALDQCKIRERQLWLAKVVVVDIAKEQLRCTLLLEPVDDHLLDAHVLQLLAELTVLAGQLELPNSVEVRPREKGRVHNHLRKLSDLRDKLLVVVAKAVHWKPELAVRVGLHTARQLHPDRKLHTSGELPTNQEDVHHDQKAIHRIVHGEPILHPVDVTPLVKVRDWNPLVTATACSTILSVEHGTQLFIRVLGRVQNAVFLEMVVPIPSPDREHVNRNPSAGKQFHHILEPGRETKRREACTLKATRVGVHTTKRLLQLTINEEAFLDHVHTVRRGIRHPESDLLGW